MSTTDNFLPQPDTEIHITIKVIGPTAVSAEILKRSLIALLPCGYIGTSFLDVYLDELIWRPHVSGCGIGINSGKQTVTNLGQAKHAALELDLLHFFTMCMVLFVRIFPSVRIRISRFLCRDVKNGYFNERATSLTSPR